MKKTFLITLLNIIILSFAVQTPSLPYKATYSVSLKFAPATSPEQII
ncbi:MAG TPA: hypothetical protein VM101_04830 [Flavitalea sp.]|nr:hypothetical protein [Flavitalea sp.]